MTNFAGVGAAERSNITRPDLHRIDFDVLPFSMFVDFRLILDVCSLEFTFSAGFH